MQAELSRQAMFQEGMFDVLALGLPMHPVILDEAIGNCVALQSDLNTGKIDLKGRAMSLIEVLKRKEIIHQREEK